MRSPNLQLVVHGERVSVTPMPGQTAVLCTFDPACGRLATHRLLRAASDPVELLCDAHTHDWALEQGIHVTTALVKAPAA
jgi:hypothetical protein